LTPTKFWMRPLHSFCTPLSPIPFSKLIDPTQFSIGKCPSLFISSDILPSPLPPQFFQLFPVYLPFPDSLQMLHAVSDSLRTFLSLWWHGTSPPPLVVGYLPPFPPTYFLSWPFIANPFLKLQEDFQPLPINRILWPCTFVGFISSSLEVKCFFFSRRAWPLSRIFQMFLSIWNLWCFGKLFFSPLSQTNFPPGTTHILGSPVRKESSPFNWWVYTIRQALGPHLANVGSPYSLESQF